MPLHSCFPCSLKWSSCVLQSLCVKSKNCLSSKNYEDVLIIRELFLGQKAWVKIHTGAFVTSVGCNKLETEHLYKVAAGPGASQLWSAQETSTDGRWGSGFHFFNTVWANQIYERTLSCQWANCGLMEKRVINIHREEGVLKVSFQRLYICCMERPLYYSCH